MYIHRGRKPPAFYGTGFWLNRGSIMPGVPEDLVVGMGAFSCRDEFFMAYSPSLDLVVARAGRSLREGRCKALHFQGNEDFLRMVVGAVLTP